MELLPKKQAQKQDHLTSLMHTFAEDMTFKNDASRGNQTIVATGCWGTVLRSSEGSLYHFQVIKHQIGLTCAYSRLTCRNKSFVHCSECKRASQNTCLHPILFGKAPSLEAPLVFHRDITCQPFGLQEALEVSEAFHPDPQELFPFIVPDVSVNSLL